jgi:hypothetical protein
LGVTNNTSAKDLYNLVGGWKNIDLRSIVIEICRIGEYRTGMGTELEIDSFIWDGILDLHWDQIRIIKMQKN